MIPLLAMLASLTQPVADLPTVVVTPNYQAASESQRARALIERYFQHFSSPDVLNKFQQDYASFVDFYGKVVDRNTLLHEKAIFIRRWPERSYRLRQESVRVTCNKLVNYVVCGVTGLVDFQCRSSERHATSAGVARFAATVGFNGDRPEIVGESSRVLS